MLAEQEENQVMPSDNDATIETRGCRKGPKKQKKRRINKATQLIPHATFNVFPTDAPKVHDRLSQTIM